MQVGEHVKTVPWYRNGVLYQIYPLSFADSNGDGYGDIQGIIQHLDYLAGGEESLGVAAIWLSPMYRSPMKDFGYDISDYRDIDPIFGTMDDFDQLVEEVHARGMKLLMDFVPNHSSDQHPWFREAKQSRVSARRDWYIWANPKADGSPPNNWLSVFGGSAWTFDKATGQYYLHTFLANQPDLNWRNPKVRAEMEDTLRFWLRKGVDGFRTDAVAHIFKDAQLRDDPINPDYVEGVWDPATKYLRKYSSMQGDLMILLSELCDVIDVDDDSMMISEAYLGIEQMKPMYRACQRHPIHTPFNFNLMDREWGASSYAGWIDAYEASLRPQDLPNYVLGNHDKPRIASRVGLERARLLAVLQLTLRGLPIIYDGDELGVPNDDVPEPNVRDSWKSLSHGMSLGRDKDRGPMPWNSEINNGFTTGTPWQPIAPSLHRLAVKSQERDPDSTLNLYRHLIHLKSSIRALTFGTYRRLKTDHEDIYAFEREFKTSRCIILLNFSDSKQVVSVEGNESGKLLISTHAVDGSEESGRLGRLTLEPFEGQIYELEGKIK